MALRLHEIELGCNDTEKTGAFYQSALSLDIKIDQHGLKVFDPGVPGLDFNASTHVPSRKL